MSKETLEEAKELFSKLTLGLEKKQQEFDHIQVLYLQSAQ